MAPAEFLARVDVSGEGLAVADEALQICQTLSTTERSHPYLRAAVLRTRSARLAELGRHEEALAAIEESVAVYRMLEAGDPGSHLGELVGAQRDLADRLVALGRADRALAVVDDALVLCREPTPLPRPFLYGSATAFRLRKRSAVLAGLGRREEALADIEQSVALYRTHIAEIRGSGELEAALRDQADRLRALGRTREAETLDRQAQWQQRPRR